jgi:uncharacterized protein
MRIVLDTNVFISAILKTNSVPAAAVHQVCEAHTLLTSLATQHEIRRVLARPYFRQALNGDILQKIEYIFEFSELVTISTSVTACRDPMDDKFLELALCGKADLIISGDKDLLSMGAYLDTLIIAPAKFLAIIQH